MAEQELIKHTKAVYKIWNSKEHNFWHKLKEFLVEIFIIVFAITVSLWFHNRSEHSHQQEDVKQFLLGLKNDLQSDLVEMQNDKASYLGQQAAFTYLSNIKMKELPDMDSLKKYRNSLSNTTAFNPNNGRFEGFRSAGKIGEIEVPELQNDIMDLYQEDIISLLASTDSYIRSKRAFFEYIIKNGKRLTDSTSNFRSIVVEDEAHNITAFLNTPGEVLARYDKCIAKIKKIIAEINEAYHLKE